MKVFLDSANINEMMASYPVEISGFTTNPTLIRNLRPDLVYRDPENDYGYKEWVKHIIPILKDKYPNGSVSLEVISDDIGEMIEQGQKLDDWSDGYAYVKVPITNTKGESTKDVVKKLSHDGIKVNLTAVFTFDQVNDIIDAFDEVAPSIVSVFAGRIYDAGKNAFWEVSSIEHLLRNWNNDKIELLWASPRQVYDYELAASVGCNIITMTPSLVQKIPLLGKDLNEFSLDTVKMFYNDAQKAGLKI